ncbi:uncharacterized protein LAESUDRAFT_720293 [Laetiporus sulphureus 93-53]|uniref:Uncharacterized protein n=1 Tax=Laetiporus sulphureus 93-53 TaxID=1314785 RepID=A0A165H1G6_9APHY|nr:uncharacterized protein LAESUDRAFT_720293 [Laetiporus sulphureus 93-53]KZT11112.1 hypothetical protein LAESUDRAFT_720293 [Laetiporus sulphureus 93-53]
MQSRILLVLLVLALAFIAAASPIPDEGTLVKKTLKQYQMKRRDGSLPVKRQDGKPSKKWFAPVATGVPSD